MGKDDKLERIKFLVGRLNEASRAYYQDAREIMPNIEYDAMYDELLELEKETGIILSNSPSQNVGYEILSDLPKERHPQRMLSQNKTKSREELRDWLGDKTGILSWKLDGLTVVLTYEDGKLVKAVTRGNGDVGEVVTANARFFDNVPLSVSYKGRLVLRGEAVIKYSDFEKINESIGDSDAKYKNPRNLCSGSVRQLDPGVTRGRHVNFIAFTLVEAAGVDFGNSHARELDWLGELGFDVVFYRFVDKENIIQAVESFESEIPGNDFPSDGLVLLFDDIEYGRSLGSTAKYPRDSIAFKWADSKEETTLLGIEWSASRTGLINPVAVFEPVELEGTTVSRASVHNISIMEELGLGAGDRITVYKANMIIPQIAEDMTPSHSIIIPDICPSCGGPAEIRDESGVRTLHCLNPDCPARRIKSFALFTSRDALNIEGLSEATLEKLIDRGFIREFADIFRLERYRDEIVDMEGFGDKSFEKLITSVERAETTTPDRLIYALGIPGIGLSNARAIVRHCGGKWDAARSITRDELLSINGVGEVLADAYTAYFADPVKNGELDALLPYLKIEENEEERGDILAGKTFVITGSLERYENREALKRAIEEAGGRTAGSVSGKTSYLITNDTGTSSAKNRKARELGVPVIDEAAIAAWLETGIAPDSGE